MEWRTTSFIPRIFQTISFEEALSDKGGSEVEVKVVEGAGCMCKTRRGDAEFVHRFKRWFDFGQF